MDEKYNALFTPWKIGNVEIPNRIVQCSMGGTSLFGWLEPNHFDKEAAYFLLNRAQDGVGLILPGMQCVRDTMGIPGRKWLWQNDRMFKELKPYMEEFHKTGSKLFIQLAAGFGRSMAINGWMSYLAKHDFLNKLASPIVDVQYSCASASATPNRWNEELKSRPMTRAEIKEMVEAFGKTAKKLRDAGVDGVEIHAVHEGYLLDQFTMKNWNFRTDEYGGSFENRFRFPVEIVKCIHEYAGDDFPVSLRYSVVSKTKGWGKGAMPYEEDFEEFGRDMEESERAVKYLADAGYDMFNCDNGTYDAWYWAHPPIYMPENCNLEEVEHIRKFVDIPVVCAGRMTLEAAAKSIAEGGIDGAGFARNFLADPAWFTKVLEDREADIRPCILCHNGCFNMCHYKGVPNDQDLSDSLHLARCAVNAEMMQWNKHRIQPTASPKTIRIIGGGIGGMEVARVAKLRGHNPVVYEKADVLGGTFIPASAESYKGKLRDLLAWYRREMDRLCIEVHLSTEITDLSAFGSDPIVVATGSVPVVLRGVPGHERMIEACDFLNGAPVGENVAVIGGGLTGCEIAYELALQGKNVSVIEMKNDLIAQKGVCLANSSYLREWFAWKQVPVYLETTLKEVRDGAVVCTDKDGKEIEIACDSVISSVGYKPAPLPASNVTLVGDCKQVGNLRSVIWGAYEAAMKL